MVRDVGKGRGSPDLRRRPTQDRTTNAGDGEHIALAFSKKSRVARSNLQRMLDLVRQRAVSSSQATVHSWWLLLHRHPLDSAREGLRHWMAVPSGLGGLLRGDILRPQIDGADSVHLAAVGEEAGDDGGARRLAAPDLDEFSCRRLRQSAQATSQKSNDCSSACSVAVLVVSSFSRLRPTIRFGSARRLAQVRNAIPRGGEHLANVRTSGIAEGRKLKSPSGILLAAETTLERRPSKPAWK